MQPTRDVTTTYDYPPGSSDSLGWTCQQPNRYLAAPEKLSVADDTFGSPNDVGTGAAAWPEILV